MSMSNSSSSALMKNSGGGIHHQRGGPGGGGGGGVDHHHRDHHMRMGPSGPSHSSSTVDIGPGLSLISQQQQPGGGGGGGISNPTHSQTSNSVYSSISPGTPGSGGMMIPNNEEHFFPFCDDVNKYEKIGKIGQGTFGEVFKARHTKTKKLVALKKVLMENEKEGFPITALREIKILQLLKHENVVNLIEICRTSPATATANYKATFYLVFDFCEHDLAGLLSNSNVKFSIGEIKRVMQQLLNGLFFIHRQKILHRDMKAANILITRTGVLKLADFGLARPISEIQKENRYTNRVVTLWYRPPELLLGARNYGPAIDVWGAGCIMAEMWTRTPILQGATEQQQLQLITQLCGTISPEVWPDVKDLEFFTKMDLPQGHRRRVKERLKTYVKDNYALDLLDRMLILDPSKRIDSDSALNHDFFWTDPMPVDLAIMLSHYSNSMFEFTTNRRRGGGQMPVPGNVHMPGQPGAMHGHPHCQTKGGHPGGPHGPHGPHSHGGGGGGGGGNVTGGQYMDRVF